jgi:ATP-binding cassette subfamily B protein
MEQGRIVEQGTHAELLVAEGAYRRLYTAQFSQAVGDADTADVTAAVGAGAGAALAGGA